jgi:hypothetical protein
MVSLKLNRTFGKFRKAGKSLFLFLFAAIGLSFLSSILHDEEFELSTAWIYRQDQIINNPVIREDSMTLLLHITEPNVQLLELPINILPLGFGNRGIPVGHSFMALNDIDVFLDLNVEETTSSAIDSELGETSNDYTKTTGAQNLYLKKNETVGAVSGNISLSTVGDRKIQSFPFDKYEGWLTSWANYYADGRPQNLDSSVMTPVPLNVNIENAIFETFKMKVNLLEQESGYGQIGEFQGELSEADKERSFPTDKVGNSVVTGFTLERKSTIKFLVLTIYALMILSSLSVVLVTVSILRKKRPPALSAAIWGVAVVFTTLQMRNLMPGNPVVGTYLDLAIYFPSILIVAISSAILIFTWLKREDFHV